MRKEFKNHILTTNEAVQLILSFSEGIDAVFQKRFSWATIKLYYAVYYLIRATLASKEIAILRCRSMFRFLSQIV